jgi:hypothetical protein
MTSLQRLLFEILAVGLALVAGVAYERHEGAKGCEQADTKAATTQALKVAGEAGAATEIVKHEEQNYVEAITRPVVDAPVVRVCPAAPTPHPSAVLRATSAATVDHAAPEVPAAIAPNPPGRDIGAPVESVGHDADAQVAALQDYVKRVCSPH